MKRNGGSAQVSARFPLKGAMNPTEEKGIAVLSFLGIAVATFIAACQEDRAATALIVFGLFVPVGLITLGFVFKPAGPSKPRPAPKRRRRPAKAPRGPVVRGPRPGGLRCAYCHDGMGRELQVHCPGCGTRFHAICLAELGGCPSLGCENGRRS